MRTPMLPLVDIVRSSGLLTNESIDTAFTTITDVFDFYGRDLAADSGHALMIGETRYALNYSKLELQTFVEIDGYVLRFQPIDATHSGRLNISVPLG
jgi:hypothetical protein